MFATVFWSHGTPTILILSPDPAATPLRPAFLERHCRVQACTRPAEALRLIERCRPAAIVADLAAAASEDAALCRGLAREPGTRRIPLLVVTPPERAVEAGRLGAADLVLSPVVPESYFETLARFVDFPRRRAARHAINLRFRFRYGATTGQAFSRDLSPYGAFLKTDRAPELGTRVELSFRLPGESGQILCSGIAHHGPAGFGVEFTGLDADARLRLARFIDEHAQRGMFPG